MWQKISTFASQKALGSLNLGLTLFALFCALPTTAQDVYTWVDEKGVLHFSETPQSAKAKLIQMPDNHANAPAPKFDKPQPKAEPKTAESKLPEPQKGDLPLTIDITSPRDDEALRSNAGFINITAKLNRDLQVGERLQLIMNNQRFDAPKNEPNWQLKNVDRGTHTFSIQSFRDGKLIASSNTITVHLQRASRKRPQ
ncbi:DUF4124 domain-containing protein [Vibrio mexicanus]|uniref:DUF4124 domain-containing protein n=1 Tax=Vibrio mexicanus TaxID=1004326 RepID=UPI00063C3F76|nr:DUF4124 domain-containing protein [Vibrio mexicanus]